MSRESRGTSRSMRAAADDSSEKDRAVVPAALAIVAVECRLPGADGLVAYEQLLASGQCGIAELPPHLLQRDLYFDSRRGQAGKTYTTLAGMTSSRRADLSPWGVPPSEFPLWDEVHLRFCEVAARAWHASGADQLPALAARTGVFVGHSGATLLGGWANYTAQVEEALEFLREAPAFRSLTDSLREEVVQNLLRAARHGRPQRRSDHLPTFDGYSAAALAARVLRLGGPRCIVDAACASSLFALQQAQLALEAGRIDAAIVGGATTNGVENLILFSHSQACSEHGSCPFDDNAGGLVSSEGYAALVVTRVEQARQWKLPILATITGLGVSSDGRGKSLWAPRAEGQVLAMRRAYPERIPLDIDYLEAHATSTQLGDATELSAVQSLLASAPHRSKDLLLGSVKSNLGHTLETAGLAGLIKLLLALRKNELPPTVNFRTPNRNFDWERGKLRVVSRPQPWPERQDHPRAAAVSAFGIGGLNAHVVVTDSPRSSPQFKSFPYADEPIAIVGRGVVLPGAHHLEQFRTLLSAGTSHLGPPPENRWRKQTGVDPATAAESWRVPTACGGYIRDYTFDAAAFRIPPKQAQQANPAQWMLLDAVRQAAREFDEGKWNLDRATTGVVIGAIFGGEFGNQLHVGLHLPELERDLRANLSRAGIDSRQAEQIIAEFHQRYLQQRPALLDETGSFTASTLASRVAKTFDLMGGACAVDADGASGLCGLALAVDFLRSGRWSAAVCGAAQRSLDLASYCDLNLRGRLVRSGRAADIPDDCRQFLPGEGVAAVLLMRLSDAQATGRKILGIIEDIHPQVSPTEEVSGSHAAEADSPLARQIGLLAGAQGLVRLVKETLLAEQPAVRRADSRWKIASRTTDNVVYTVIGRVPLPKAEGQPGTSGLDLIASRISVQPGSPVNVLPTNVSHTPSIPGIQLFRFSAPDHPALSTRLQSVSRDPRSLWNSASHFAAGDKVRLSVLAGSPEELSSRLTSIVKVLEKGKRRGVLETERAVLWEQTAAPTRTAWLFPGQGAQYSTATDGWLELPPAQGALAELDAALTQQRLETFDRYFSSGAERAAEDIWGNQLWSLGRGVALAAVLQSSGARPDAVLGHSFGEYPAWLAAGVLSLPQIVRMVKARADAVALTVSERGRLISVRGTPAAVDAVLRQRSLPACMTHFNAPQQTVIAASLEHVAAVREALSQANLASLEVPVPAAYHTPRMQPAEDLLQTTFARERFLPPRCACLSPTSLKYLSEPDDLRRSLISQMTRPVQWVPAVERLVADGFTLLVEVGPNNILSRLCSEIAPETALCFGLDMPGRPVTERLLMWEAVRTTVDPAQVPTVVPRHFAVAGAGFPQADIPKTAVPAAVVDLRKSQRSKRQADQEPSPVRAPNPRPAEPSVPVQSPAPSTPAVAVPNGDAVRRFLTSVVVDLTGYSADVVDFEADLEADLGIDSIKKAQIVGELAENLGLSVAPSGLKLGDFRTLADISRLAGEITTAPAATHEAVNGHVAASNGHAAPEASSLKQQESAFNRESMERFLIDLVIDQTGYAAEVVDLDADMEGDLGIDSIKQAQLLGEIQQQFDLTGITPRSGGLTSFTTLRSILDFLQREIPESGAASFRLRVEEPEPVPPHTGNGHTPRFSAAALIPSDTNGHSPTAAPAGIRGVDQHDEIPEAWQELFTSQGMNGIGNVWQAGQDRGRKFRSEIRAALRLLVDHEPVEPETIHASSAPVALLEGLAAGAGVNVEAVRYAHQVFSSRTAVQTPDRPRLRRIAESDVEEESLTSAVPHSESRQQTADSADHSEITPAPLRETGSMRMALRMVAAPRRSGTPETPRFTGPALVLGNNPLSREIQKRFAHTGHACHVLPTAKSLEELDQTLERLWHSELTPHLFITTSHDADALRTLDAAAWDRRRLAALRIPYRVCQLWMQRLIEAGRIDGASVVALTSLGGDFGFSGKHVVSPEGGLGALLKAMMIEGWMRGIRHTPMKVLDLSPETTPQQAVDQLWRELAVPSYDPEIGIRGNQRFIVQPAHLPLPEASTPRFTRQITPGGTWIVAGGGRGITAVVARELAARHGLRLHLVSASPVPQLTEELRAAAIKDRSQLRRQVIQAAGRDGENAMEAWRKVEKGIEIDATLRACAAAGVTAVYHSCDIADAAAVRRLVEEIRRTDGPIRGVIQGAGFGQDARFDRKRADKVQQCLAAKIDGTINLMQATEKDPLDWFVGFGSISGRFGANGHTDYSLANDSLAKLVDRYRALRPDVRSVAFHWHAWGDIGMATKPETRLALEMINMEFMPAAEGLAHFLGELERGGDEPEVLITDRHYFRKFFQVQRGFTHPAPLGVDEVLPLLDPAETGSLSTSGPFTVTLNPVRERFLQQHLVDGKPTLPYVFAIELMAEAARRVSGKPVLMEARNVQALQAIKFSSDAPLTVKITAERLPTGEVECRILADILRRDGRLIAADREYFRGLFRTGEIASPPPRSTAEPLPVSGWQRLTYPEPGGPMYHGPDLQLLREFHVDGRRAMGRISASVNNHLSGEQRPTTGWSIPCAVLDACLYACVFPDKLYERSSLPVGFESIRCGRLPDPGEDCHVEVQLRSRDARGAKLDFDLIGQNGDVLLQVTGHQIGFRESGPARSSSESLTDE